MKKNNKKGFTLAELLIVVAIIAVLAGISIPVFTAQRDRANAAVDVANIRALYAEAMADYVSTGETGERNYTTKTYKCVGSSSNIKDASIGGLTMGALSWAANDVVHIKVNAGGQTWTLEH